jgi:hypothetical protein
MKGSITIIAVIVLLIQHILKCDCGRFWNLRRNFGQFSGESPGFFRWGLELGQGGLWTVWTGVSVSLSVHIIDVHLIWRVSYRSVQLKGCRGVKENRNLP